MLDHKQHDWWNFDYLVAPWFWLITAEGGATTVAFSGMVGIYALALLEGEKVETGTAMALLAIALAARAFALALALACGLKPVAFTGWRL